LNEVRSLPVPDREWSWVDLGVVAAGISGDMTRNITLPTGPMTGQLLSTTGTYTLPPGFLGTTFLDFLPRMTRPGYANHPNGSYTTDTVARTFNARYFPPSPGTTQTLIPQTASLISAACEISAVFLRNVAAGALAPVAFPPGPRSLTPGLNGCIPPGKGLLEIWSLFDGSSSTGGLAIADLSNDGKADVVILNGNEIIIYHGQDSGEGVWYALPDRLLLDGTPSFGLAVADLDGNGRLDIVSGNGFNPNVAVFLQTAPGSYTMTTWPVGSFPSELWVGDVTGDGIKDIVIGNPGGITWVAGDGAGGFGPPTTVPCGATAVAAAPPVDMDGDGRADVACAEMANQVHFLRGTPTGLQDSGVSRPTPAQVGRMSVGDLNGDGLPDLAITTTGTPVLQTWVNQGTNFQFATASDFSLSATPWDVRIAELNGDSLRDVVTIDNAGGRLLEYAGTGGGALDPFPFFTQVMGSPQTQVLAIGDLNADGNSDVAVADTLQPLVRLFASRQPIPAGAGPLSFVAPPDTRVYVVTRGVYPSALDYEVISRGTAGLNVVDFPATSPLRPSRPTAPGQYVSWYPLTFASNDPATLSMNNYRTFRVPQDSQGFTWSPSLYRR
ncbi:MAG TPA: VCBS repeat-containing protein, partial [Myxococcales bacterium]|nr:VCBS repeat-containing protein [Myxococcales bacterium]